MTTNRNRTFFKLFVLCLVVASISGIIAWSITNLSGQETVNLSTSSSVTEFILGLSGFSAAVSGLACALFGSLWLATLSSRPSSQEAHKINNQESDMNKQVIGWISLVIIVIASSAIGSVRMFNFDPAITGVIALGILMLAGFAIRKIRSSSSHSEAI